MTGCSHDCTGKDQRAYRVSMSHKVIVACADHAAYLRGQGITLIEVDRRITCTPVMSDRRRVLPRWIGHLTARDETALR